MCDTNTEPYAVMHSQAFLLKVYHAPTSSVKNYMKISIVTVCDNIEDSTITTEVP